MFSVGTNHNSTMSTEVQSTQSTEKNNTKFHWLMVSVETNHNPPVRWAWRESNKKERADCKLRMHCGSKQFRFVKIIGSARCFLFNRVMGQFLSTTLTTLVYSHPECQEKVLYFKKLSDRATSPIRGSELAAGYDLYSAQNTIIPKQGKALVMTDIAIALPDGCYGRVAPR